MGDEAGGRGTSNRIWRKKCWGFAPLPLPNSFPIPCNQQPIHSNLHPILFILPSSHPPSAFVPGSLGLRAAGFEFELELELGMH
jgi:hypothetical protein